MASGFQLAVISHFLNGLLLISTIIEGCWLKSWTKICYLTDNMLQQEWCDYTHTL